MSKQIKPIKRRATSYRAANKKKARALPLETRQKFMDCMWAEGMAPGEAATACGIDFDEAPGILDLNIQTVEFIGRESV